MWQSADPALVTYVGADSKDLPNGGLFESRNLGLYTYSYNNPIVMKDPDGLLTIIIHGTFAQNAKYAQPGSKFNAAVSNKFGEQAVAFNWSGGNNINARTKAANNLAQMIKNHKFKKGEKLNIVAHSHGGNVLKEYTQMPASRNIDNAVTLGTPQRDDYTMNMDKVDNYLQVFSKGDSVQPIGGKTFGLEAGFAGRTDPAATKNIEIGERSFKGGNPRIPLNRRFECEGCSSHGNLHTPSVWKQIEPEL